MIRIRHLADGRNGSFLTSCTTSSAALRQLADVGESEPDQAVVAAGHLEHDVVAHGLLGGKPMEVERLLGRFALAVDRDDVGEADCVVTWIVEA